MNWSKFIRQTHRWLSMAFTLMFIAVNVIAFGFGEPAVWVYVLPVVPLILLLLTGLYLFALPYLAKRRPRRGSEEEHSA